MPETIEWPHEPRGQHHPRPWLWGAFALLLLIFVMGRTALRWWVDLLWFDSLGYSQIFWRTHLAVWGIFAGFGVASFALIFTVFRLLLRAHREDLPGAHVVLINGRPVELSLQPVLRVVGYGLATVVALAAGSAMASSWQTLLLWWSQGSAASTAAEPIFGHSLGFYFFTLPAWELLFGWMLGISLVLFAMAVVFMLISGSARLFAERRAAAMPVRGVALTAVPLLLAMAARTMLGRYELLFEHHTIFDGVTYTDAHVLLTGKLCVALALVASAAIALVAGIVRPRVSMLVGAIAPVVVVLALVGVSVWYVNTFLVKPNEMMREQPYISYNIEHTRAAYGLDHFELREFPAETEVAAAEAGNNQATLSNIRLWDWHALQDTLRQIQEIRTYYDFPDIDIDRYRVNGSMRQVMLSARELNVDKLPASSRNWINDRLIYTHGYGLTMNPVNGFTNEGLPLLMMSNMPVQSTVPELKVARPEIYFGEQTSNDVYVKTRQQEFNYPQGDANNLSSYEGSGGIELGGFLRRLLIAADRGDLFKLPFSDDIAASSRLLMRRTVRERVEAIAPFLHYEHDPYLVVGGDGRLRWILDGFTMNDNYPYAAHTSVDGHDVNYVRNSVKVVVDAYNGTTDFYVFDNDDPLLRAWRGIFPGLFKDASAMPEDLRAHVRYPETMLRVQGEIYGLYHMTNPSVFYNREDMWTVASEVGLGNNGEQSTEAMQPNYVLMKLPGEQSEEFVEILPFTPANRNNLIGWIAGRSDGAHYGAVVAYSFPKTRLVDGPLQIEARIDQNAQLSGQLSLWNQQGSRVRRGTLLVIPTGRALLYAEPIYLQAERSPMPELRLVVLALQDKLAYGPTFESALASLFGAQGSSLTVSEAPASSTAPGGASAGVAVPQNESVKALAAEAGRDFAAYQQLTAQGKLSEAGQKLEALRQVIERLNNTAK